MTNPARPTEAENICKEAYFDMTVHPSENPPLGAFMDEYIGHVQKRIDAALAQADRLAAGRCVEAIEDKFKCLIGGGTCQEYPNRNGDICTPCSYRSQAVAALRPKAEACPKCGLEMKPCGNALCTKPLFCQNCDKHYGHSPEN